MPSLGEAYDRRGRERDLRRPVGGGLFALGVVALLAAVALATTDLHAAVGLDLYEGRHVAGVLGGLGVPAVLVGVAVALPNATRQSLFAGLGAAICVAGTAGFWYAYPERWWGVTPDHLTFEVAAVYTFGAAVALWYVLSAVATFHTRNDPQGTVTLEIETGGETKVVEVEGDVSRERLKRIAERQD
jgi:hypothetical protein